MDTGSAPQRRLRKPEGKGGNLSHAAQRAPESTARPETSPTPLLAAAPAPVWPGDPRLVGLADEPRDLRFYRRMRFIRDFEETLLALFEEGLLNGTTHACIGQEADCVGVIEHLREGDHIFSNHRCHGHYLAWSGDARGLLAEIMGRPDGVVGGIGGSQHICAPGFKSNGILGGTVPAATGIALAMKLSRSDGISVVFVGDGAFGEGVVYESLNMASLWELPLLVVVENNAWSQSTPLAVNFAGDMAKRFEAFGIPTARLESTDVVEIDAEAERQVGLARESRTPRAFIIDTYRLCHHSKSDDNRPADEIAAHWPFEPLTVHGARLDTADRERIDSEVAEALTEIVDEARTLA
jgi:acetoin:2,6-dichlorophenolindophenol oxidoreductase subunit alpha